MLFYSRKNKEIQRLNKELELYRQLEHNRNLKITEKERELRSGLEIRDKNIRAMLINSKYMTIPEKAEYLAGFIKKTSLAKINLDRYRQFLTIGEADQWGKERYLQWGKILTSFYSELSLYELFQNNIECPSAIEIYSGYGYQRINEICRKHYIESVDQVSYYKNIIDQLTLLFYSAPRLDEGVIVYRRIDEKNFYNIVFNFQVSGRFYDNGFLSTSLAYSDEKNNSFIEHYTDMEYILKICVDKGSLAMYSSVASGREFETELLLPRKSELTPIKVPYYDEVNKKIVMECKYRNSLNDLKYYFKIKKI